MLQVFISCRVILKAFMLTIEINLKILSSHFVINLKFWNLSNTLIFFSTEWTGPYVGFCLHIIHLLEIVYEKYSIYFHWSSIGCQLHWLYSEKKKYFACVPGATFHGSHPYLTHVQSTKWYSVRLIPALIRIINQQYRALIRLEGLSCAVQRTPQCI